MHKCFGMRMRDGTFKKEKRYLFITLIAFSTSYLVDVIRNAVIYTLLRRETMYASSGDYDHTKVYSFFCKNNFNMSLFNIGTYVVTELMPYLILFSLNLSNFRQMGR